MDMLIEQLRVALRAEVSSASNVKSNATIGAELDIASANKLLLFFANTLGPTALDDATRRAIGSQRAAVAHMNGHVLHLATRVSALFQSHGVDHIFFKGPIQQKVLYGNFFAKPSVDLDVLVRRTDFARARELLFSQGFVVPKDRRSVWWTFFLGEQPFKQVDLSSPSVDLHHRLQQPGCPTPRQLGYFFNNTQLVHVGSQPVPTANLKGIVLIAAMNLLKAVYHREPAGSYAFDLLASLKLLGKSPAADLGTDAEGLDLKRTLIWATRVSAATFQTSNPLLEWELDMDEGRDVMSRGALLNPQAFIDDFPKRRDLLVRQIDRPIVNAGKDYGRWLLSEGARILFER